MKIRSKSASSQRGFTLAEVLLSIVVFTISVVGIVAVQRATLASQENSLQMRSAQRIAQRELEDMSSFGFTELIAFDFAAVPNPAFPYDDFQTVRVFPYRDAPVDINWAAPGSNAPFPPGMRRDFFRVLRRVSAVPETVQPAGDPSEATALHFEVWVLWIDHNPSFPPPATATVNTLLPDVIDSTSANFLPWARGVHLTSVRANDMNFANASGGALGPTGATGATGPTGGP